MLPTKQATATFLVDYSALEMAAKYEDIQLSWWKVMSTKHPIANVRPGVLALVPCPDLGVHRLRPASDKRSRRHPPPPASGHGGHEEPPPALADGAAACSDSDEEVEEEHAASEDDMFDAELVALLEEAGGLDFASIALQSADDGASNEAGEAGVVGHEPTGPAEDAPPVAAAVAPPPPPPPKAAGGAARRGATATVQMPGGSVSFYASKNAFEAVCENRHHGRCVSTRTCRAKGRTAAGHPKGGRPVAFLAAWLGHSEHTASKEEHWAPECFGADQAARMALRQEIAASGEAGRSLLGCERPAAEGEPLEPLTAEGYWP